MVIYMLTELGERINVNNEQITDDLKTINKTLIKTKEFRSQN